MIGVGDDVPEFELPDTDGEQQALLTPAVVVFTCNHCPYALAWHDRLMEVARDYEGVHFYAINPNDAERYPRDSLQAMQERVRRDDGGGRLTRLGQAVDLASGVGELERGRAFADREAQRAPFSSALAIKARSGSGEMPPSARR